MLSGDKLKKQVIIVAGGKGKRMHAEIPKQFLNISGKPILFHTMECFYKYSNEIEIILILPEPFIDFWNSLSKKYELNIDHQIEVGGDTRYQSVKNGLRHVTDPSLVAIHDGVRPLVSKNTLNRVFKKAKETGNAIPIVKINESVRRLDEEENFPVNRREYRLIQTPQCFHSDLIKRAYQQEYSDSFTDDATVVESLGVKINLVEGNSENIKITRPGDMKIAEALLK